MAERRKIAIKDIALDDDRRAGGKGALEKLSASIKNVGLINAITVRKSKEGAFPYTIIAGRRRVEAAALLDWTEIEAVIYETDEKDENAFFTHVALAENVNRLDLHPIDEGVQYTRLLKEGATLEDLTAYFDRSASHIYQRMKLADLIFEVQTLFRNGRIKISAAAKIASLPKKVQNQIYQNIIKNQIGGGNTDKTIDRIIGQMMRMPLDFLCESCERCTTKRTHYSNSLLFPEYSENVDYCMDSRCYKKNVRTFYQEAVTEFLKNYTDVQAVYIYEQEKNKAEYLRSLFDEKPLIKETPVHVYHESFEDCKGIVILDDEDAHALHSFSSELLRNSFIVPVLYFQDKSVMESFLYYACDDETYERLFTDETQGDVYDTETADCGDEANTGGICTESNEMSASGTEQGKKTAVFPDEASLTPSEQFELFSCALFEYLRKERSDSQHPLFYSDAFMRFLEERFDLKKAFRLVFGVSFNEFNQKKRQTHLTYQQLLELYVYSDIAWWGLSQFDCLSEGSNRKIIETLGFDAEKWQSVYMDVYSGFRKARTDNEAPKAEKKTATTAGM